MSPSLPLVQPASKPCAGLQPSTSSNCWWENINIPKHISTQTPSHTYKKKRKKRTVNRERGTAERTGDKTGGWVTQRDRKKKKRKNSHCAVLISGATQSSSDGCRLRHAAAVRLQSQPHQKQTSGVGTGGDSARRRRH